LHGDGIELVLELHLRETLLALRSSHG
jgi:hypothetical protein